MCGAILLPNHSVGVHCVPIILQCQVADKRYEALAFHLNRLAVREISAPGLSLAWWEIESTWMLDTITRTSPGSPWSLRH
jgi:hypothetical protein